MRGRTAFGRDPEEIRLQDYSLSDEQKSIRETFAAFFASRCPSDVVRKSEPLGFDRDLWTQTAELGAAALRLPESAGGVGGSLVDLALIAEEAGRVAAPVPLAEAASSVPLLALADDTGAEERVEAAASGRQISTLALKPLDAGRQILPAGAVSTLVLGFDGDDLVLFELAAPLPQAANLGRAPLAIWTAGATDVRIVIASGSEARRAYEEAVTAWRIMTAAALVGIAKQAVTEAVEFAKTRLTSGVPIGALQGVSHPLAQAEVLIAASRTLNWKAAWFADNEPASRPELVPMAFAHAVKASTYATATALHMQGGFGFTVESDVTLFFRRAKGWGLVGDPQAAIAEVGAALIDSDANDRKEGAVHGLQPV